MVWTGWEGQAEGWTGSVGEIEASAASSRRCRRYSATVEVLVEAFTQFLGKHALADAEGDVRRGH